MIRIQEMIMRESFETPPKTITTHIELPDLKRKGNNFIETERPYILKILTSRKITSKQEVAQISAEPYI
jgi:hypothetical protein